MNNNNLVVIFHLGMADQEIDVYQDGICVKQDFCSTADLVERITTYCATYNIPRINLCGNKTFVSKFAKELNSKYAYGTKEINIIAR